MIFTRLDKRRSYRRARGENICLGDPGLLIIWQQECI
jgi:hypothetical protein